MKKLSLLILLGITISMQTAFAGAGVYDGWVTIDGTKYNLGTGSVALNGANLGSFNHGISKSITYTEADVWKDNNNGNICSARLNYKITGTGSTSYTGSDKSTGNMAWKSNSGINQIWSLTSGISNSDILSGLSPGTYNIAFWISATGSTTNNQCNENLYLNNSGNNYVASFTINPNVTFNSNGGSGSMANQFVTYNAATALTANSYTRTGYIFDGWNTNADGTGTSYANQASVTLTANTTLYAKWKAAVPTPTISSVSSSPGSSSQTYKGATITITGTSLLQVTTVKLGGAGGTDMTILTKTATSITFTVPNAATNGTVYVSDGTNNSTSTESFTNLGYISTATGYWSNGSTWLGGTKPGNTDKVTIAASTKVTLDNEDGTSHLTINQNGEFDNGATRLIIAASGKITNNGTFTGSTGNVYFNGVGTVEGTNAVTFNNLTINTGALTLTKIPTIDGVFTINGGNVSAAPIYTSNSTLSYNVTYSRFDEWNAVGTGTIGTTPGYPNNVTINTGTFTLLNNDDGTQRAIAGNLLVNSGATFSTGAKTADLTINGKVSNNGTINLSSSVGGDLKVKGDFSNNGTFNSSSRAVFFIGSAKQTVSSTTIPLTIDYVINDNNSSDGLHISSPLTSINITNNGNLTIASGVTILTSGTVSGSGTTNVEQALSSGRNWWYLSSPVSAASSSIFGSDQVGKHVEDYVTYPKDGVSVPYYTAPFSTPETLAAGRGYVIKRAVTTPATYTFTGGSLNTGDISPLVTRTGTTAAKRGFNLVGNPYPSYLDWNLVFDAATATNMRNAIWFRTMGTSAMTFQTYSDGEGVPDNASSIIAPMQAFWVKVDKDNTAASLTFKNTHRSHFVTGANPLKVKALDARPRLRLVVSNGTTTDELLVVGKSYASDVLDSYDIEKFSNDNVAIPEIYSVVSNQELVINSMNELTEGKTVTLGFRPGQAGTFTIETTQLENIDAKVVLVDKVAVKEQELTAETPYTFASDETPTNDRFLIKLVSKVPTGVDNTAATGDLTVYVNRNNRIQLICGIELNDQATVSVYNVAGQKLSTQKLSKSATELNGTYNPGVYMIQLTNGSQAITKKLIIR